MRELEELFYKLSFVGRPGMLQRPAIEIVPFIEGAKLFNERWHQEEEWVIEKYEGDPEANHLARAKDAYELGWFSYVRTVWARLQKRIAEDAGNAAARTAAQKERVLADLEVPPHLLGREE